MAFLMEDYINPSSQPKVDLDKHKEIFEKQIQSNIKHKLSSIN